MQKKIQYLVPTYVPTPFILEKAKGIKVWDTEGNVFFDFTGGIAVTALGHCPDNIIESLVQQANTLWHTSNHFLNVPALQLAEILATNTFADKVFFTNSGTEANEAALKLARIYANKNFCREKNCILAFDNAFHGRSLFTVSVGGTDKYKEGFGPLPTEIYHTKFNDIEAVEKILDRNFCAVIIEPIQGEGGVIPAQKEFLHCLKKLCDKFDILLIFDEVQTGIGRTGHFFAYQYYQIIPDILTCAKALGNGFPIGAMLAKEHIAQAFQPGTHGTTSGGNPLACYIAKNVVNTINVDSVYSNVQMMSKLLKEKIEKYNIEYPVFSDIRGLGLLIGCELSEKFYDNARKFVDIASSLGLLVLMAGSNVVRLAPPLTIKQNELEEGMNIFQKTMELFYKD